MAKVIQKGKGMKAMVCVLFFTLLGYTAFCGPNGASTVANNPLNSDFTGTAALAQQQQIYEEGLEAQRAKQAMEREKYNQESQELASLQSHLTELETSLQNQLIELKAPDAGGLFRVVNGETNYVYDFGWSEICGKVLQTLPDGVLITGRGEGRDCFIEGYPGQTVDDEVFPCCQAKEKGVYAFTATSGARRTVRKFVYGTVASPTAEMRQKQIVITTRVMQEQIDATTEAISNSPIVLQQAKLQKEKALETNKAAMAKQRALAANEKQAAEGDPFGLLRMGERYRDGEGVSKDLGQARKYFQRAVDAGSPSAVDELKGLPVN